MASLTQWTWVSVNSGSCWWTGRPGMLQLSQIDYERLAWKSFHSEGLCSRLAVYTQTAETKGCPAAWWHHPGQNKCRCPAGLASGSVFVSTAGLSAFLRFPTVLSTKFSSLPFSVPAPCKMRWTWSSPAPQPLWVHLPFSPRFSSHVAVIGSMAPGWGFWCFLSGHVSLPFCLILIFLLSLLFQFPVSAHPIPHLTFCLTLFISCLLQCHLWVLLYWDHFHFTLTSVSSPPFYH